MALIKQTKGVHESGTKFYELTVFIAGDKATLVRRFGKVVKGWQTSKVGQMQFETGDPTHIAGVASKLMRQKCKAYRLSSWAAWDDPSRPLPDDIAALYDNSRSEGTAIRETIDAIFEANGQSSESDTPPWEEPARVRPPKKDIEAPSLKSWGEFA